MTTVRTPIKRNTKLRFTPEVIEAYKRALAFSRGEGWRREYAEACAKLHELLGRTAADMDVMDTIGRDRSWSEEPEEFAAALAIRLELKRCTT